MIIAANTLKQIIKEELEFVLSEQLPSEEHWNKSYDTDVLKAPLVFFDDKFLGVQYPNIKGNNHALISHAIKHSNEFEEKLDVRDALDKLQKAIKDKIENEEMVYVKINNVDYKMNKKIETKVEELLNTKGSARDEKKAIRREIAKLIDVSENDIKQLNKLTAIYTDKILPTIRKLTISHLKAFLDFHHDEGELQLVDLFGSGFINQYNDLVNSFYDKHKDDYRDLYGKKIKVANVYGNKRAVSIRRNNKHSTFFKQKR